VKGDSRADVGSKVMAEVRVGTRAKEMTERSAVVWAAAKEEARSVIKA
jgi:hypothetical protein